MRTVLQVHVLAITGSAVLGLALGMRFIDPAVLGALLGLGAGLGAGSFVAALATGTTLAGGRGPQPGASIWDDEDGPVDTVADDTPTNGHTR